MSSVTEKKVTAGEWRWEKQWGSSSQLLLEAPSARTPLFFASPRDVSGQTRPEGSNYPVSPAESRCRHFNSLSLYLDKEKASLSSTVSQKWSRCIQVSELVWIRR